MVLSDLIEISISFMALFSFLAAIRGMLIRDFDPISVWAAVLRFAVSMIFLYAYLNFTSRYSAIGALNHIYGPVSWFMAPGVYRITVSFVEQERGFGRYDWVAFLPGLVFALVYIIIAFIDPSQYNHLPVRYFQDGTVHWLDVAHIAGLVYGLMMHGIIWYYMVHNLNLKTLREQGALGILIGVVLGSFVGTVFFLVAYLIRHLDWIFIACSLLAYYHMALWVFSIRETTLERKLDTAIQKARLTTRLEGVDLGSLRKRLQGLMEDKVYLNEELSVAELADQAGVKHYQLSEFLNRHMDTNFAKYVNGFRANEAARILAETPEASILSVAYQCGFKSKANFNAAFKAEIGCSPRDFLKRQEISD